MTLKQEAAMRLAREALEMWWPMTATYINTRDDAVSAIDEALAEQPAQQQEPVAKVCHDLDGHIGWNPKLTRLPDEGTCLYTSPQPSKPWQGLTEEERIMCRSYDPEEAVAKTEAKLKEKNT